MSDLLALLQAAHRQHRLWPTGATVLVAVSGGPDSLCLLHLLHRLAPLQDLHLHVAHFNHRLRPESNEDAHFVQMIAARWQIEVTIGEQDVAALARRMREGIEAAARQARYGFFAEVATATGADAIALGHTLNDQAETVLLRLLRGAGTTGLAAMRPRGFRDNHLLVRPLLEASREQTEDYCREHDLRPRYDVTNSDPRFLRNRVRADLLPLLSQVNPRIVTALSRTARLCADDDDCISELLQQQWPTLATMEEDRVILRRAALLLLHPALQRRALRHAVGMLGPLTELGSGHLDRMLDVVRRGRGRLQLPGGRWMSVRRDEVSIDLRS